MRLAAEHADALGVLDPAVPVTHDAFLHGDHGPKGVDPVIATKRQHAAGQRHLLAGGLVMKINAIGVIRSVHVENPGIGAGQRGAADLGPHARPLEETVYEDEVRSARLPDLSRRAAGVREIRQAAMLEDEP